VATTPIRVRFAPAPTGYLHIGGARTALFNWIYARQHGGEFVLRIEDTDTERSRRELIEVIYRTLEWLGLDWDGEPVHQSDRLDVYRDAASRLVAAGRAYHCDCTPDDVKARADARGGKPGYDGHCRDRAVAPADGTVVRFRTPDDGTTAFDDVIRGHISFENAEFEDFVIVRSTGAPTFYVANAVDDADMGITHIIRGEDLINVTPRVLLLRDALGIDGEPVFAHLPLIVNEQRKKLSKRRDDVSVGDYIDRGYLAEAMVNYLAVLGWGPPDGTEIRPLPEIVDLFRLDQVNKAGAFFDLKKLDHFNGEYIRALPADEFVTRSSKWLFEDPPWPPERFDATVFEHLAPLVQERVKTLAEVPGYVDFMFLPEPELDEKSWRKANKDPAAAASLLDEMLGVFATCEWEPTVLMEAIKDTGERLELPKSLYRGGGMVRIAVTGRDVGPPLGEVMQVMGRDEVIGRLREARARLAT
jgi:glutamyl-tRNA synthetase